MNTYSANLAEGIDSVIKILCGAEGQQIEVVHLHAWAVSLLQYYGAQGEIASPEDIEACWQAAIAASGNRELDPVLFRREHDDGHFRLVPACVPV